MGKRAGMLTAMILRRGLGLYPPQKTRPRHRHLRCRNLETQPLQGARMNLRMRRSWTCVLSATSLQAVLGELMMGTSIVIAAGAHGHLSRLALAQRASVIGSCEK